MATEATRRHAYGHDASVSAVPGDASGAPSPALAPPPGNPRFPLFDGLRGIVAVAILAFHAFELTGRVGLGVAGRAAEVAGQAWIVFFVISGFLLYRPYVSARAQNRPRPSTRRYARRRAIRILPAYWGVLTLLAIFPGIVGVFSGQWWRYYGYLQIYSDGTTTRGIAVAWTLCVEVTFYICLPLWAIAVRRITAGRGARGLLRAEAVPLAIVAAFGIGVQLAAASQRISHVFASTLLALCTWLAIGMALAVASVAAEHDDALVRRLRSLADHPGLCWIGSAIAFVLLMPLVPKGGLFGLIAANQAAQPITTTLARIALEAALVILLVLPVIFGDERRGIPRRVLALRPIAWLGVISYSFYLWHLTVAQFIAFSKAPGTFSATGLNLLGHVHVARTAVLFAASFTLTAVLATASYRLVEFPFLRRKESQRPSSATS
jgi:peptidoglycan/LPS O-acetylase OafA/YrhL